MVRSLRTLRYSIICTLIVLGFLFCMQQTHAQGIMEQGVSLTTYTPYPKPGELVQVSLEAYTVDTAGATVRWYEDSTELTDMRDARSIMVRVGDIGTQKKVRATISKGNTTLHTANINLTPSNTDIIVESQTYIPSFYKGRALPSMSAPIRLIAMHHSVSSGDQSKYSYNWKKNGSTMFGGAVLGKQTIELTMPRFDNETIEVTILDSNSTVIGEGSTVLTAVEPEILFYEHNPLRGTSRKAIASEHILVGEEVGIYGEPYFMDTNLSTVNNTHTWRVDNIPVSNTSDEPHLITLRRSGTSGSAMIGYEITANRTIPQIARGMFSIIFQ